MHNIKNPDFFKTHLDIGFPDMNENILKRYREQHIQLPVPHTQSLTMMPAGKSSGSAIINSTDRNAPHQRRKLTPTHRSEMLKFAEEISPYKMEFESVDPSAEYTA